MLVLRTNIAFESSVVNEISRLESIRDVAFTLIKLGVSK